MKFNTIIIFFGKVCTQLINNQYQVISVDIYYGAWDQRKEGTTWLWVNTTTRPTIWYTTSGQFVGSDPGAADTVAKFALTGSGANVKLTTVYYNEKITGDYNLNIIKNKFVINILI